MIRRAAEAAGRGKQQAVRSERQGEKNGGALGVDESAEKMPARNGHGQRGVNNC